MFPSGPQLPPPELSRASHRVTAAPPSTEILFRCSAAKNATDWPSGENKGATAPSVPASSVAVG